MTTEGAINNQAYNWVPLQAYSEKEDAMVAVKALEVANISAQVDVSGPGFDPTYANNVSLDTYRLMVDEERMVEAQQLIDELEPAELYDNEHDIATYLQSFEDEDLLDLLYSTDVHNADMSIVARQVVLARGLVDSEQALDDLIAQKRKETYSPKPVDPKMMAVSIFLLLVGAFGGLAIFTYILFAKGTDPAGRQYWIYDEKGRTTAIIMIGIGLILILPSFLWAIA